MTLKKTLARLLMYSPLVLSVPGLHADVIYTYTGNLFTNAISPFTHSDSVSGTITLSNPLPANDSTLTDYTSDVVAVDLTDGVDTINTLNNFPNATEYYFATSNGAITQWAVEVYNATQTVGIGTVKVAPYTPPDDYYEDFGERCGSACNGDNYSTIGYNNSDAGTWTEQVVTDAVPEPAAAPVLGVLLATAGVYRRKLSRRGSIN